MLGLQHAFWEGETIQLVTPSVSSGLSGARTSGGENEREDLEQEWKPPDEELIRKLVDQIEFYFSDENLEKDAFLLKHVRRNKLGYVSVKLLTSFKKVRLHCRAAAGCQGYLGYGLKYFLPF